MKILVTGAAGFIGSALVNKLLERGDEVTGLDNHNNYYDPVLKESRLKLVSDHKNYNHCRIDISDFTSLNKLVCEKSYDCIVNLAAQAGVRYSLKNPHAYIESNIVGFANILETCRKNSVKHLVYASSSSVYGANTKIPFSTKHNVDHPLSIYAASKKSNELMAHAYSHLYQIATTGLRFFTVYGPWGRPDMALFLFTESILKGKKISVYNQGNHLRDFTYIDDIIDGIELVIDNPARSNSKWIGSQPDPSSSLAPWRIYNIGNSKPVNLLDYINAIENALGLKAQMEMLPLQPGDVKDTYADVEDFRNDLNYSPKTSVEEGIERFVKWYKDYFSV